MNPKQRSILLFVFDQMESIYGRTFIQKLFYIIKMQAKLDLFEYAPYNYGPFSKELNQGVSELVDEGIITEQKIGDYYVYSITGKVAQALKMVGESLTESEKDVLKNICLTVKKMKPKEILEYVYQHYPESTIHSLIKKTRSG